MMMMVLLVVEKWRIKVIYSGIVTSTIRVGDKTGARVHETPLHAPLSVEGLRGVCADVLAGGGPVLCTLVAERGGETGADGGRSRLTRFPFFKVVLSGRIEVRRAGRPALAVKAGEAVLFARDTFAHVDYPVKTRYLRLTFGGDFVFAGRETVFPRGEVVHELGRARGELEACRLEGTPGVLAVRILERMADLRNDDLTAEAVRRRALAQALLGEVAEWLETVQGSGASGESSGGLAGRMRHYVDEHCREAIDRERVAAAFGVTPGHVSRVFRQAGGAGFQATLLRARLEVAQDLLRTTEWPIEDVAVGAGFSGAGYFIAAFRRALGTPPQRWRRQARQI